MSIPKDRKPLQTVAESAHWISYNLKGMREEIKAIRTLLEDVYSPELRGENRSKDEPIPF